MSKISEAVDRHAERFLALPGVSAISVGKKSVGGVRTDKDAIVLHVDRKQDQGDPTRTIPADLDGHPTDVVEEVIRIKRLSTDPFERHDPMISGISVTSYLTPGQYGSIGCFIVADGSVKEVPKGLYLLTCHHVIAASTKTPGKGMVIQPGKLKSRIPEQDDIVGDYVHGLMDADHDCAVVSIDDVRTFVNEVPAAPHIPGRKELGKVRTAAVMNEVSKFGAATHYTQGSVLNTDMQVDMEDGTRLTGVIKVAGKGFKPWVNHGDSGSVIVLDDYSPVGMIFASDPSSGNDQTGYVTGYAYDLTKQIQVFSNAVTLA